MLGMLARQCAHDPALGQGNEHRLAGALGEIRGMGLHGLELGRARSRHPAELRGIHLEAERREMV